jgi:hypothetical protein
MLKERLNPCATLLYHWIRCHEGGQNAFDLNLEHFQVWTAEFFETPASIKDVDQALLRLMQLQLIQVAAEGIRTVDLEDQSAVKLEPLPKTFWKIWTWKSQVTTQGLAIAATILLIASGLAVASVSQRHSEPHDPNLTTEISK